MRAAVAFTGLRPAGHKQGNVVVVMGESAPHERP